MIALGAAHMGGRVFGVIIARSCRGRDGRSHWTPTDFSGGSGKLLKAFQFKSCGAHEIQCKQRTIRSNNADDDDLAFQRTAIRTNANWALQPDDIDWREWLTERQVNIG